MFFELLEIEHDTNKKERNKKGKISNKYQIKYNT